MSTEKSIRRFILSAQISLLFVFLVIIAGSVVRATGAGMGCPDWPKCFGKWIPPTNSSELPANYKELYAGEHNAVAEFNALKTWTEYGNRLAGALLGVLVFIQLLLSLKLRKIDKRIFRLSLAEVLLIAFQGWLGAKVVSSNLAPAKITIHMLMALLILAIALAVIYRAKKIAGRPDEKYFFPWAMQIGALAFFFTIVQIMLGTQVREEFDILLSNSATIRTSLFENPTLTFLIHRSFSVLILLINLWWIVRILRAELSGTLKNSALALFILLLVEIAAGFILNRFSLPAAIQPVHLLLACFIFSVQFLMLLRCLKKQE